MDRRKFLAGTATLGTGAALAAPALGQSRTQLNIVNLWSEGSEGRGAILSAVAARVSGLSGGQLTITVTNGAGQAADAALSGADGVVGAEEAWMGKSAAFGLMTSTPGGLVERELEAFIRQENGQALWDALSAAHGMKSFYLGDTGAEYLWAQTVPGDVSAFSGASVAARGLAARLYTALGANVTTPAMNVVAPGGAAFAETGPLADQQQAGMGGLNKVALGTITRPSAAVSLTLKSAAWNGLNETQQRILTAATTAQSHITAAEALKRNALAQQILRLTGAAEVTTLNEDVFHAMMPAARDVLNGLASDGAEAAALVDGYKRFGEAVQSWTRVSEAPFATNRRRSFSA
ncbi:TRAP-type mannitol/chloroaromatic compound transport system substrate-binding protein [Rubricella aquisinus]|uniref:TRAP-type mannitol/chloroaromatic compound transport system substrate-binding protein n=1 Tax=Rubricella aquisinus TaxID=2028108 RepID=A0A840X892_9RHOB|nr:hypothetical protein [Rubricella aquisinus]MBB5516937.1 TRAP-type mannitol/chloroaromatic compound transport system substrate-binding protein [Rubricella aquisinus]